MEKWRFKNGLLLLFAYILVLMKGCTEEEQKGGEKSSPPLNKSDTRQYKILDTMSNNRSVSSNQTEPNYIVGFLSWGDNALFDYKLLKSKSKIDSRMFDTIYIVPKPELNRSPEGRPRIGLITANPTLIYTLNEGIEVGDTSFMFRDLFPENESESYYRSFKFERGYVFSDKNEQLCFYVVLYFENWCYPRFFNPPYITLFRVCMVGGTLKTQLLFSDKNCCGSLDCFGDFNNNGKIDFAFATTDNDTLWAYEIDNSSKLKKIKTNYIILNAPTEQEQFKRTINKKKSKWF